MKKIIFLFAMVFVVTYTFAQNTSNTLQNGDVNSISVTQTGSDNLVGRAGTPNFASSQTGDNNSAVVTQNGEGNTLFFEQGVSLRSGTFPSDGATHGDDNQLTSDQTGVENVAWGYSIGDGNIVAITQTVGSNRTGHWLWGDSNHANLSQTDGTGNYSYAAANSSGNRSTITQVGVDNDGTTSQGWIGYANHNNNTASISQIGTGNTVSLADGTEFTPALPGYTSDLWGWGIQQYGYSNEGSVYQDGFDNQAAIYQFGDENEGTITQNTNDNKANLIQIGSANVAEITQEIGDGNIVNLKQDGTDGDAIVIQQGSGNVVKGLGVDAMATSFDGSFLDVTQIGTTNLLNLQQADGASATVYQDGLSNNATVIQNQ